MAQQQQQQFTWMYLGNIECSNGECHNYIIYETPYFFNTISECYVNYMEYLDDVDSLRMYPPQSLMYYADKLFFCSERPTVDLTPYKIGDGQASVVEVVPDDELTKSVLELERLEKEQTRYQWRIYVTPECSNSSSSSRMRVEHMLLIEKSEETFGTMYDCLRNFNENSKGICAAFAYDEFQLYVEAIQL